MFNPDLPFAKVRRAAGLVFLSGEVPFKEDGTIPEGIEAQTDLVLRRIAATLESEGLGLSSVVSCTVYLSEKSDFNAFNDAYARHFSKPYPARTTVEVAFMMDFKVEISVVASEL